MGGQIRFPHRFRGLDDVALGGYVAGALARRLGAGGVEVTLCSPPPLERELEIAAVDGGVTLRDGEVVVAEAVATELEVDLPAPIAIDAAEAAMDGFAYAAHHPRQNCVVCSTARTDGLGIFPGPLGDDGLVASVWAPDDTLPAADGEIAPEIVWSALDCPPYFGGGPAGGIDSVLGRHSARLTAPIRAGRSYAIGAWPISIEGRKRLAGAAVWSEAGELCAVGRGLWIELREPAGG